MGISPLKQFVEIDTGLGRDLSSRSALLHQRTNATRCEGKSSSDKRLVSQGSVVFVASSVSKAFQNESVEQLAAIGFCQEKFDEAFFIQPVGNLTWSHTRSAEEQSWMSFCRFLGIFKVLYEREVLKSTYP